MAGKSKLTQLDWIKGSFRSLAANGPQSLKAEVLARSMKVSKGSFYWHFKDIAALKKAMLDHWEELATHQIIAQVDTASEDPKERLYNLLEIAGVEVSEEYGAQGASSAIRNWSRFDDLARSYVSRIDDIRLGYVEQLFSQIPQTREHARLNSQTLYATLIGAEQLEPADAKACLLHALNLMLQRKRPTPV